MRGTCKEHGQSALSRACAVDSVETTDFWEYLDPRNGHLNQPGWTDAQKGLQWFGTV